MGNESPKKGLRDELGDGYLSLLDSVRHSFEQAAWGQEGSGNLADDFYRWVGAAKDAPKTAGAAEPGAGVEVRPAEAEIAGAEPSSSADREWKQLEAWIDGKAEARTEPQLTIEHERDGPSREGPELGD